jgi:hypothetical protein
MADGSCLPLGTACHRQRRRSPAPGSQVPVAGARQPRARGCAGRPAECRAAILDPLAPRTVLASVTEDGTGQTPTTPAANPGRRAPRCWHPLPLTRAGRSARGGRSARVRWRSRARRRSAGRRLRRGASRWRGAHNRSGLANLHGRGVLKQVLLDRIPVQPGDGDQPPGDGGPGQTCGLKVAGEELNVGAAASEQTQLVAVAPGSAPFHVPARRRPSLVPLARCYAALRLQDRQTAAVARQAISTVGATDGAAVQLEPEACRVRAALLRRTRDVGGRTWLEPPMPGVE